MPGVFMLLQLYFNAHDTASVSKRVSNIPTSRFSTTGKKVGQPENYLLRNEF